jgi:hypothetical protein
MVELKNILPCKEDLKMDFTYKLYYTLNGQKLKIETESKEYINEVIAKNNLQQYVITQNGIRIFDNRINPFTKRSL